MGNGPVDGESSSTTRAELGQKSPNIEVAKTKSFPFLSFAEYRQRWNGVLMISFLLNSNDKMEFEERRKQHIPDGCKLMRLSASELPSNRRQRNSFR